MLTNSFIYKRIKIKKSGQDQYYAKKKKKKAAEKRKEKVTVQTLKPKHCSNWSTLKK